MQHLSTEELIGFAEGSLPEQQVQFVNKHAHDCKRCDSELREWVSMLALMRGFALKSAPPEALRNCRAIYSIPKPTSKMREILASLVFDSFAQPATAGVRGDADSRQLLLQGDGVDLHVRISQTPNLILGQLLQRSEDTRFVAGARIRILWNGDTVGTTVTDSLGEFRFQELPNGKLQLCADLASQVRLVADLPKTEN